MMGDDSSPPPDELSPEIDVDAPEPPPGTLLLPGRLFPLDFSGGELTIHGTPLFIDEATNAGAGPDGATGLTVWDGSVVLAKYLEAAHPSLAAKRVVEVGSGTGIVGLAAALLGGAVSLTDIPYCLPNLRRVVARNAVALRGRPGASAVVRELDWTRPEAAGEDIRRPDLVVGADVVWIPSLVGPLARTLAWLEAGEVLLAHKTRSRASDRAFLAALDEHGFEEPERIDRREHHAGFSADEIEIWRIRRRGRTTRRGEEGAEGEGEL
jgi:predicted nicotinamide N-methyase